MEDQLEIGIKGRIKHYDLLEANAENNSGRLRIVNVPQDKRKTLSHIFRLPPMQSKMPRIMGLGKLPFAPLPLHW